MLSAGCIAGVIGGKGEIRRDQGRRRTGEVGRFRALGREPAPKDGACREQKSYRFVICGSGTTTAALSFYQSTHLLSSVYFAIPFVPSNPDIDPRHVPPFASLTSQGSTPILGRWQHQAISHLTPQSSSSSLSRYPRGHF